MTTTNEKLYRFTSDAGHGWLHVKRKELEELGILDQISRYSYQRGGMVYLEEDSDMTRFINAKKARGERVGWKTRDCDRAEVRSYECFAVTLAEQMRLTERRLEG